MAENSVPKSPEQQMAKFEQLMNRLEKATAAGGKLQAEAMMAVLEIKKAATPKGAPEPKFSFEAPPGDFEKIFKETCFKKVDTLLDVTKELNNEGVLECVNLYLEIFKSQSAVLTTMASCSKPENPQFMVNIAKDKKNKMMAIEKKHRQFMNHIRCIEDSLNLFAWFLIPNEDKDAFYAQLADFYGAIDFVGTKLQNNDLEKKWFRAFRSVQQDFYEFVKAQYPHILNWTGSNADAQGKYSSLLDTKVEIPAQEEKQIVEKKEEPAKKPEAKAVAKAAVPKKPVKELKFRTWEVSNYVNDEITFEEDDIDPGVTVNFFNCEKLKVKIPGKFKNFMLQKCKSIEIHVDACVSMGEIIKSERIQIYVETTVPQISVELCNGVQVFST